MLKDEDIDKMLPMDPSGNAPKRLSKDEILNFLEGNRNKRASISKKDFLVPEELMPGTRSRRKVTFILDGIEDEEAVTNIKAKEAVVVKYFKDAFNMDFYKLRDEAEKNTNELTK